VERATEFEPATLGLGSRASAQQVSGSGSTDRKFGRPVQMRKAFQRIAHGRPQPMCRRHAALQMEQVDDQATGIAVKQGIHPTD
jgi:hypothetical protein